MPELWKLAFDRSRGFDGLVLAHEIGHAFGLCDIYSIMGEDESTRLRMPFVRYMASPMDWSGGSGESQSSGNFVSEERKNRSFKFSIPLILNIISLRIPSIPASQFADFEVMADEISRRTILRREVF